MVLDINDNNTERSQEEIVIENKAWEYKVVNDFYRILM